MEYSKLGQVSLICSITRKYVILWFESQIIRQPVAGRESQHIHHDKESHLSTCGQQSVSHTVSILCSTFVSMFDRE